MATLPHMEDPPMPISHRQGSVALHAGIHPLWGCGHCLAGLGKPEQPYLDEAQKELGEEAPQQAEVVSGSGQDGVDGIAHPVRQVVAAHPVLGLQMPDDRLHRCPSLHQSPDGLGHAPLLAINKDLELPR